MSAANPLYGSRRKRGRSLRPPATPPADTPEVPDAEGPLQVLVGGLEAHGPLSIDPEDMLEEAAEAIRDAIGEVIVDNDLPFQVLRSSPTVTPFLSAMLWYRKPTGNRERLVLLVHLDHDNKLRAGVFRYARGWLGGR